MKHAGIFLVGAVSIFYIAAILFLRGNDAWELLRAGDLNELGDFLAAFFTPLAFGWYTGISYSPRNSAFSARNSRLHETISVSRLNCYRSKSQQTTRIPYPALLLESLHPGMSGTG